MELEIYVIRPKNGSTTTTTVISGEATGALSESSAQTLSRRQRRTRRLVGGWVQVHHPSSSFAQAALEHLGGEFIGPSRAVTDEDHAIMLKASGNKFLTSTPHRIIKVESTEMQVVAGVNHRFHVVSQNIDSGRSDYYRRRVTVYVTRGTYRGNGKIFNRIINKYEKERMT